MQLTDFHAFLAEYPWLMNEAEGIGVLESGEVYILVKQGCPMCDLPVAFHGVNITYCVEDANSPHGIRPV